MADPVRFTDAAGVEYRALDATMHDGKMLVANPPARWAATFCLFRPRESIRRLYYAREFRSTFPTSNRALLALAVAAVIGYATWQNANDSTHLPDFHFYYLATRLWAQGIDPYAMRPSTAFEHIWPLPDRLFYPLPALMLTAPFVLWSARMGQALFIGSAAGLLAWRLSRDALWPLLIFVTPSLIMTGGLGQWSLWIALGTLVPSAGFLLTTKPTLGLACFLSRPSWRAVISGVAIVAVSLVLMPRWPMEWLANMEFVDRMDHLAPIRTRAGIVLLLALLRWRDPGARLLLAMACMPQIGLYADQLPLFLVATTRREAACLVLGAWASFLAPILVGTGGVSLEPTFYAFLGCYAPALYVVLRRPNAGALPMWLERHIATWPRWAQGTRAA